MFTFTTAIGSEGWCPITEYYIRNCLEQAQSAPAPATIFSLFYKGRFVTTDLSVCMNSRFDKISGWKGWLCGIVTHTIRNGYTRLRKELFYEIKRMKSIQ